MKKIIVVAGATGNLGERIIKALVGRGAEIRAIVRSNSNPEKIAQLEQSGVVVFKVDTYNIKDVAAACDGASCVVSALAGLKDVIIDTQKILLDAAVLAKVPRFIPSDFSMDFRKFSDGENRNLDLRRTFHTYLDAQPIAATTIFNGAFADLLTNEMPLVLNQQKMILYWGDADHKMGFTTVADTAIFTANVALEDSSPRYLSVLGDQMSPRQIKVLMTTLSGQNFRLFRPGGAGLLGFVIKMARFFSPAPQELYPAWQGMQYMHNMIDERADPSTIDNDRFSSMTWTSIKDVLKVYEKGN